MRKLCCHPCWEKVSLVVASNREQTFVTGLDAPPAKAATINIEYLYTGYNLQERRVNIIKILIIST
jgi:hypothetical protein